uniref:Uncharacterized protein n=1 Tax=Daucus carota subsp. sativus TaxID=79200 RepID=A0A166BU96_DAUCS
MKDSSELLILFEDGSFFQGSKSFGNMIEDFEMPPGHRFLANELMLQSDEPPRTDSDPLTLS